MKRLFIVIFGLAFLWGNAYSASPSGEPGDDMAHAVLIEPGTYTEYLDSTDRHDFYKFKVAPRESVTLILTPSSGNDFDLALYDCKGTNISNSEQHTGKRDVVYGIVRDSSCEYWYADAFEYSGKGNYYLELKIDSIKPVWTLMVFLNGDNNLQSYAYQDVNEMEAANPLPYVNIVVQFDTRGTTKRYLIQGDDDINNINSPVVDNPGEQNMGNPNTLANFVRWAVRKYPAKKYGLIIWDHGDGWYKKGKGVSDDDSSNDGIGVSNGELGQALSSVKSIIGKKLDFLGFDACLMGMWEVLDIIKDYADYAVVSEQTEGAQGWYYTGFANIMPNTSGAMLANNIVNSEQGLSTLAAVNLGVIDRLTSAIDTFAAALINARPALTSEINKIRAKFGRGGDHEYGDLPHIDIYRFAYYVANDTLFSSDVRRLARDVMGAVDGAVTDLTTASSYRYDSHGISIYYPSNPNDYNDIPSIFQSLYSGASYDKLPVARNTKWDEFIKGEEGGAHYDYTLTTTGFSWIDTRNSTGITGDDQTRPFSLPFSFTFYGKTYNSVNVCSNGFLSFTSSATSYRPQTLPNSADPNAVIAPFWRDLNPAKAGNITYYAGRDKFVITWEGVKNYANDSRQTFQVILYPNGEIVFQYKNITNDVVTSIGLEDESGTHGKGASFPRNGVAYRWVPSSKNILTSVYVNNLFKGIGFDEGNLTIKFATKPSSPVKVGVYDVMGRLITREVFSPANNINISLGKLHRGIYIARVGVDGRTYLKKFYIMR